MHTAKSENSRNRMNLNIQTIIITSPQFKTVTTKDILTIVSLASVGSIVAVLLSSDKPTAGLTALAVLIASASLYESAKTSEKIMNKWRNHSN